jgi:hypothetical protein
MSSNSDEGMDCKHLALMEILRGYWRP